MATFTQTISDADLIAFAEALQYKTNTIAGTLFPDEKTKNLEAKWYNISDGADLPVMAQVHAFDTEANIGSRKPLQEMKIQKMLIKEKINQSEKLQMLLDTGVTDAKSQIDFLFDDYGRLGNNVYSRADVMRCQLLTQGEIAVRENNLDFVVDYKVPAEHKKAYDWSNPDHNILADIQAMVDTAEDNGKAINTAITSPVILRTLLANKEVNRAINGGSNLGILVTAEKLNTLLDQMFGFTIVVDKSKYQYQNAAGAFSTLPYFDKTKFVLAALGTNGTLGKCLWGETPEERAAIMEGSDSFRNMVYMCQNKEWDPATIWTKATALAVPALRDSQSLVIGSITLPADIVGGSSSVVGGSTPAADGFKTPSAASKGELKTLTVTSEEGDGDGKSYITVDGAGAGGLVYTITNNGSTVTYGKPVSQGIGLSGANPFEISAAGKNGKTITVAEVDEDGNAIAYGTATLVSKE